MNYSRQHALWTCTFLFLLRVIGQFEALMQAPVWLPPMSAWYSGLVPYAALMPAQILILMLMCILNGREKLSSRWRWRKPVRIFSLAYFALMLIRLVVQGVSGATDLIEAGGIPVAFHWILALYLLTLTQVSVPRSVPLESAPFLSRAQS
ncbi:MAG: hypothetical protein ACJ8MR_01460 [Povalibacter sp.]